jgi:type IV pilus assembly protein PilF
MFKRIIIISILLIGLNACSTMTPRVTNPTAAKYNVELGLGYLKQGNVIRAKQKLLLALKQDPRNPIVQDAMGYFLENTGELKQAAVHYRRAVELAPRSGAAQNNYGTFLCRVGRYPESIQYFLAAVQDPAYLHTSLAYENAGKCALKIPDKKLARLYFVKAKVSRGL